MVLVRAIRVFLQTPALTCLQATHFVRGEQVSTCVHTQAHITTARLATMSNMLCAVLLICIPILSDQQTISAASHNRIVILQLDLRS